MSVQMHKTADEAGAAFLSQARAVLDRDRPWMGLIVWVAPDGTLRMDRTTYNFPIDRASEIAEMIKRDAVAEMGLDHSPLPLAAGFGIVGGDDMALQSAAPASIAEAVGET